jgi:hypothetical protein
MGTGSFFPGLKRSGRGVNHPPPSKVEVKERVDLYLYSPYGSSWSVLGRTLVHTDAWLSSWLGQKFAWARFIMPFDIQNEYSEQFNARGRKRNLFQKYPFEYLETYNLL